MLSRLTQMFKSAPSDPAAPEHIARLEACLDALVDANTGHTYRSSRALRPLKTDGSSVTVEVVLAYPAEAMTVEAANAFLKTLEEPLGQVRIILISENAHRLLPTIRSRCLGFAMPWPKPEAALAWLQTKLPNTPVAQLQTALQATGGRALDASAWLNSPLASRWTTLPRALAQGQVAALADCSPREAMDTLSKLAHDLWAMKVHAAPRYFQSQDLPRPPSAQALLRWGQQLTAWARSIEHPYKTDLLLENMVAQTAALWQRPAKSLR